MIVDTSYLFLPFSFRATSGVTVLQEQFSLILLYTMPISISSVLSREYYHAFDGCVTPGFMKASQSIMLQVHVHYSLEIVNTPPEKLSPF